MLNRRDVILSAAAMIAGSSRAAATSADASTLGTVRDEGSRLQRMTTSTACSECAIACSELMRVCVERTVAGDTEFAALQELAHDCCDICTVAATLLRREGQLAPAICQACADACDRLLECCAGLTAREIQRCEVYASRCAIACRALIVNA